MVELEPAPELLAKTNARSLAIGAAGSELPMGGPVPVLYRPCEFPDRLARSIQTGSPLAISLETQHWQFSRPWDAEVKATHLAASASYNVLLRDHFARGVVG